MKKTFVIDTTVVYDKKICEYGDVISAETIDEVLDELKKMYHDAVGIKEVRIKLTA